MDLVDEENDVAVAVGHLLDDALQTLLKLAFIFGSCNQGTHVERVELLVLKVLRHVAPHYALGETFNDGCLACARLANEDRVVLCAARQDLQNAANLLITANHRVELALACFLNEVLGIFGQALIVFVARRRLHLLSLAQLLNGLNGLGLCHSCILQDAACCGAHLQKGEEQRLDACKLVAVFLGEVLSALQHRVGVVGEVRLSALHAWQALDLAVYHHLYLTGIGSELLEYVTCHILGLHHHTLQKVYWLNRLLSVLLCGVHSLLNGFLSFDCEFVKCHILISFLVLCFLIVVSVSF